MYRNLFLIKQKKKELITYLGPSSDPNNVTGWTNYPIVPVTVSLKK